MDRKPDFFIVGAAKSGTTSLYSYLEQHADIFMAVPKEMQFFGEYRNPWANIGTLSEYLSVFSQIPPHVRAGESSNSYLYSETAAREIAEVNPEAKIIILLRNPIDRAYSQYWQRVRQGEDPSSFEDALDAEPQRRAEGWDFGFHYARCGLYADQVERYFDVFGRAAVRVYLAEQLKADAQRICHDLFGVLGVDVDYPVDVRKQLNRGGMPRSRLGTWVHVLYRKRPVRALVQTLVPRRLRNRTLEAVDTRFSHQSVTPMRVETRRRLSDFFREDVRRLGSLLQQDVSHWTAAGD